MNSFEITLCVWLVSFLIVYVREIISGDQNINYNDKSIITVIGMLGDAFLMFIMAPFVLLYVIVSAIGWFLLLDIKFSRSVKK